MNALDFGNKNVLSTAIALLGLNIADPSSAAWPVANLAIFVPIRVAQPVTVYKLVMGAGATAAGNFDLGIYDSRGNKIVASGATAKLASAEQVIDIADTQIGPGLYYLALSADGTDNYVSCTAAGTAPVPLQFARLFGSLEMAAAYPLPSTATFAARTTTPVPALAAYLRPY